MNSLQHQQPHNRDRRLNVYISHFHCCSVNTTVIVIAIVDLDFCRNYGCSLSAQYEAADYGCQQVLWLYGEDHQITEAGTMNIFLHWINEDGG